jgi:hypothetical protein
MVDQHIHDHPIHMSGSPTLLTSADLVLNQDSRQSLPNIMHVGIDTPMASNEEPINLPLISARGSDANLPTNRQSLEVQGITNNANSIHKLAREDKQHWKMVRNNSVRDRHMRTIHPNDTTRGAASFSNIKVPINARNSYACASSIEEQRSSVPSLEQ